MTSKNWFFKLMAEDLKRRVWLVALISLVLFFSYPVMAMLFTTTNDYSYDSYYNSYQRQMEILVSLDNTWMPVFLSVAVIVVACSSFSYLNSKSKVDFYHSLPVRREKLFLVNYIDGYLIMAVLYACFLLISIMIGGVNGAGSSILLKLGLEAYFVNMSFFLLLYATVIAALMMTGNRIVGLLGVGVFNFYIPIMAALLDGYCSTWLLTYYSDGSLTGWGMVLSPYIQYIAAFDSGHPVKAAGIALIAGLLVTLCSLWLYKKRPSEGAGKSLVFAVSKPIIRIGITMASAMAGAMFGWSIRGGMGWTLFFLICGAVIAHCVIEIIYHADFKKLFSNRLQLAGCIAAGIVMVIMFRYDVMGYDRYLPDADSVSSVSIDLNELDTWVEYGKASSLNNNYMYWDWAYRTEYLFEHMNITEAEPAIALARKGIDMAITNRQEMSGQDRYYYNYSNLYIKYQLKSGRTITRSYNVSFWDIEDVIEDLYAQDEFKYGMYPLLTESDGIAFVRYDQNSKKADLCLGDTARARQFYEAYRQDLMEQTIASRREENPIAELRFVLEREQELLQEMQRIDLLRGNDEYSWKQSSILSQNFYPVYPSFKRTIAFLKEEGIDPGDPLKDRVLTGIGMKAYANYIYGLTGDPAWEDRGYSEHLYRDLTKERFYEMVGQMYPSRYSYYNPFMTLDEGVEVIVSFVDGDEDEIYYDRSGAAENSWNYVFPVDKVPASMDQEILRELETSF